MRTNTHTSRLTPYPIHRFLVRPLVLQYQKSISSRDFVDELDVTSGRISSTAMGTSGGNPDDPLNFICDLREHDVPYTMRVSIDLDIRVGAWYVVQPAGHGQPASVKWQRDLLELCEPRVLAYDIECEKSPLKFPNADVDRIFMISYMTKDQGYLLINRLASQRILERSRYDQC